MPEHASITYRPGRFAALASTDVFLLADLDPSGPMIEACWEAVHQGAGVDGLLGMILREGLRNVPGFALAARTQSGLRLLVSGKATGEVLAAEGEDAVVVDAAAAPTWVEQRFDTVSELRLAVSAADDDATRTSALPLVGGVVLARSLRVIFARTTDLPLASPDPAGAADTPEPDVVVPPAELPPEPEPDPPIVRPPPLPDAVISAPPPLGSPIERDSGPLSRAERGGRDSGVIESLPWRTPSEFQLDTDDVPIQPGPEPPRSEAAFRSDAFGARGGPSPESRPATEPTAEPYSGLTGTGPRRPVHDGPLWDPNYLPSDYPPADEVPYVQQTVERPTPSPGSLQAPMVQAVVCTMGHLNPPYGNLCRVCNGAVAHQDAVTAPRPSLGVLVLSTGDTVRLDRDVVLGRAPFHADTNAQSRPHLVQLSSPGNDISRSHVRVGLEGWHVQIVDLASTNGTVVTLPGQAPVRLRAHDPFTIIAGTTVTIADEVTVRYEVPS